MEHIDKIFQKVIDYGKIVRSSGKDGLEAWNNIKNLFDDQLNCEKWTIERIVNDKVMTNINDIYDYVYNTLDMKGDEYDDKIDHELWEKKHFFLQLIRIIKNNPEFSFRRLMQIAYNIGQLSNYIDNDPLFAGEPKKYFYDNDLYKISAYVDFSKCTAFVTEDVMELNDELENEIIKLSLKSGGGNNYYEKYIKYKNKYLKLKQSLQK
jgi:hypothetical protein